MKLALIPEPQALRLASGSYKLPDHATIGIDDARLFQVAQDAQVMLPRAAVNSLTPKVRDTLALRLQKTLRPGGYRLRITARGMVLDAANETAAWHGLQTLQQILRQVPTGRLPCLTIIDWPDLEQRGTYYDVCRGRVPRLERLMEQVDLLAQFKMNQMQLYMEHTFRFRGHPDIGRGADPLSAQDIMMLDEYCRERHVELVPSLASFGHLATVLKHKQYRALAEDWGIGKYVDPKASEHRCIKGWTLSPANPKIYPFLDSLFAELLPCFSSRQFNICCDETWDLGLGQTYELCQKKGKGEVYLGHIIKVNRLAKKYGKKCMFWGDIIRKYPRLIKKIPRDVTVLDWGYSYNRNFEAIKDFKKAKLSFYGCPGTSSWVTLFPRLHEATANIHGFAAAAKKHGATGLLNTDWGDGGHYNFMELSWHGYLAAAEQAWNTKADMKSFTKRFCKLFLHVDKPDLANAVTELGDVTHLNVAGWYQSVWTHIFFSRPGEALFDGQVRDMHVSRKGKISRKRSRLSAAIGRDALKRLTRVRHVFVKYSKVRDADPHQILPYWIFSVDTLIHAARKLNVFGPGGRDTQAARRKLKSEMRSLMRRFEKLWLARNHRSEIRITLGKYKRALRGL